MTDEIAVPTPTKWEPAVGVRILRTKDGDKLQQRYWRRVGPVFEHEWQDVPVETEEEVMR